MRWNGGGRGVASNPREEEGGVLGQETKILGLYILGLACKKVPGNYNRYNKQ